MTSRKMALRSISANKLRAVLTMLGIIIGVIALVVLVSMVDSATNSITQEVTSLGNSQVNVYVYQDRGKSVKLQDLEAWVDSEPMIAAASPGTDYTATGKHGIKNATFAVYGVTQDVYKIQNLQLTQGRFLTASDLKNSCRVCVIPEKTAKDIIGYTDCLGEEISLDGLHFRVVGVLKDQQESMATLIAGNRKIAYIPYTSLMRLTKETGAGIKNFYVGAAEGYTLKQAEDRMNELMKEHINTDNQNYDFYVSSENYIEEAMGRISGFLNILLGGIAAISLIVGGIGIMNIMLVTVTERTREIGIRKAIGASRKTILVQFLIEAVVLCMLGCALGIFASWGLLQIASTITASASISFHLQGKVVFLSVLFCFMIGVIFGLYPANKAAKMKPIDALHYGG